MPEVINEFFDGELPDPKASSEQGKDVTRKALLVKVRAGDFSSVTREATEQDKVTAGHQYQEYMTKKGYEEYKNVGPGAQPGSIKGDARDEAFAGRPQPDSEPKPEAGQQPGERKQMEPTRQHPTAQDELSKHGKSEPASGTENEPETHHRTKEDAEKDQGKPK